MCGEIVADSRPGTGSTFRLVLPLARIASPPPASSGPAVPLPGALRVLAAEDNPVNQLVLRTLLRQVGIEPLIVDDGAQVVEAWARQGWDVVLMDLQMPVMDGLAATRAIRARETAAGLRRTPVIGLTANILPHQVDQMAAAGMDDHVGKPIDVARLFAALNGLDGTP